MNLRTMDASLWWRLLCFVFSVLVLWVVTSLSKSKPVHKIMSMYVRWKQISVKYEGYLSIPLFLSLYILTNSCNHNAIYVGTATAVLYFPTLFQISRTSVICSGTCSRAAHFSHICLYTHVWGDMWHGLGVSSTQSAHTRPLPSSSLEVILC